MSNVVPRLIYFIVGLAAIIHGLVIIVKWDVSWTNSILGGLLVLSGFGSMIGALHPMFDRYPNGAELIRRERYRQINEEGFDVYNDEEYTNEDLAIHGACYLLPSSARDMELISSYGKFGTSRFVPKLWYWAIEWWKPTPDDRIRELVKGCALGAAEIDKQLKHKRDVSNSRKTN